VFFILLFLGGKPATAPYVVASQFFTFTYFAYFLVIIPVIPVIEKLLIVEYQHEYLLNPRT
jgi:quinol-cytochrome oxidoreductase complex cytochrome b subunit